jgi:hypothetical protein
MNLPFWNNEESPVVGYAAQGRIQGHRRAELSATRLNGLTPEKGLIAVDPLETFDQADLAACRRIGVGIAIQASHWR